MDLNGACLVAQMVKHLPTMWETWVQSLGQEDPLEKEMATHSSVLAWRIPWTEEPGRLQSMGVSRFGHNLATKPPTSIRAFPGGSEGKVSACNVGDLGSIPGLGRSPGEGNGNPLQYSCLENSMDRGAWQATSCKELDIAEQLTLSLEGIFDSKWTKPIDT